MNSAWNCCNRVGKMLEQNASGAAAQEAAAQEAASLEKHKDAAVARGKACGKAGNV